MFIRGIGARGVMKAFTTGIVVALAVGSAPAAIPPQHEAQKLLASDGMPSDKFGFAVDRESDTLIIGAPQHYPNALPGSFYVFTRDQTGHWSQQQRVFSDYIAGQAEFLSLIHI